MSRLGVYQGQMTNVQTNDNPTSGQRCEITIVLSSKNFFSILVENRKSLSVLENSDFD